jgi:hypothetical protein
MTKKARNTADRAEAELSATTAQMLSEARDDVQHADQKASVLLATLGIGFAAVIGGQLAGNFDSSKFSPCGQILWWAGVVAAVASVALSAWALWPRYKLDDRPEYGITYWGHIAAFKTLDDFDGALSEQGNATNRRGRHQLWRLSQLVLTKYRLIRSAIICGGVSGLLLGLASIVIR